MRLQSKLVLVGSSCVLIFSFADFIMEVSRTTGIMIDPVYTGKAVFGLVNELKSNPDRFKGKRILYIHTGKYMFNILILIIV